ncbi:type I methionyl aminopeptidase [Candidatus Microgenomates bacterium]|nr:type I methionyl aminopeptidase [Candidatus Microgenomates bacterium]
MKPKTDQEVALMRTGGRILATVLEKLRLAVRPGISGIELDKLAAQELKALGGEPAFLGYEGYPNVLCVSVNDVVVHGLPNAQPLQAGDVVSLDFGVRYQGLITDGCISIPVEQVDPQTAQLVADTGQALQIGIGAAHAGQAVRAIGQSISAYISPKGYGIVRDLVGHGVGHDLHEPPEVPHYDDPTAKFVLKAGMTIAIEPMITLGTHRVSLTDDGWSIKTVDSSRAAQFEHTVLITEGEAEVLTKL